MSAKGDLYTTWIKTMADCLKMLIHCLIYNTMFKTPRKRKGLPHP